MGSPEAQADVLTEWDAQVLIEATRSGKVDISLPQVPLPDAERRVAERSQSLCESGLVERQPPDGLASKDMIAALRGAWRVWRVDAVRAAHPTADRQPPREHGLGSWGEGGRTSVEASFYNTVAFVRTHHISMETV